jgi:hypothetical protein
MDSSLGYGDEITCSMGNNGAPTLSATSGKSGECEVQLILHIERE